MKSKKGADHRSLCNRMKRIEGQVKGVTRMIHEEAYCVDILTQLKAVKSALSSVQVAILEGHMQHCVSHALKHNDQKVAVAKIDEIMVLLKKSLK